MYILGNQSTHSQRRQKWLIIGIKMHWESRENFPCCYVMGMLQHVKERQKRGANKPALHTSFQLWVVFCLLALPKVQIKLLSYRVFLSVSSLLIIFTPSSLVIGVSSRQFYPGSLYISDEKLQWKGIWFLKTTCSPDTTCIGFSILLSERRHLHIHNLHLDSPQISDTY